MGVGGEKNGCVGRMWRKEKQNVQLFPGQRRKAPCEGKPLVRGGDLRPRCWSGRRGEAEKGAETGSPGISHNSEKSSGAGR